MPTKTFFNLPEEKRRRLIDAAWEEFTSVSFGRVSINRIIHQAEIPRGSFYQYFADKEDLFCYLLQQAADRLTVLLKQLLQHNGGDLFSLPLWLYDALSAHAGKTEDELLDHCIALIRVNPGTDLLRLSRNLRPIRQLRDVICTDEFRRKDEETLKELFALVLAVSGPIISSCIVNGGEPQQRTLLCRHLEIVKRGACA